MTQPTSSQSETAEPLPRPRLFIRLLLILTILLAVSMIAVLYIRWNVMREPNAMLLIIGDERLAGASVQVNEITVDGKLVPLLTTTIRDEPETRTPVFLRPSRPYRIIINKDSVELLNKPFTLLANSQGTFDLRASPTTRATAR
jgi:hypothetical protein